MIPDRNPPVIFAVHLASICEAYIIGRHLDCSLWLPYIRMAYIIVMSSWFQGDPPSLPRAFGSPYCLVGSCRGAIAAAQMRSLWARSTYLCITRMAYVILCECVALLVPWCALVISGFLPSLSCGGAVRTGVTCNPPA